MKQIGSILPCTVRVRITLSECEIIKKESCEYQEIREVAGEISVFIFKWIIKIKFKFRKYELFRGRQYCLFAIKVIIFTLNDTSTTS